MAVGAEYELASGKSADENKQGRTLLVKVSEQRIGYAFKDGNLLREALTHGSALDGGKKKRDYDRLEFLGDRVLGLVVAERLFGEHQNEQEGE